jgi:hypothetical protein
MSFHAATDPSSEICARIAAHDRDNPFHTESFLRARTRIRPGGTTAALWTDGPGDAVVGCLAFLSGRSFRRRLEIVSAPAVGPEDDFWDGVLRFCARQRIAELFVGSFGSARVGIPSLGTEVWRRVRREHVVALDESDPLPTFSGNHRRNVRSALRAGLTVHVGVQRSDCEAHVELVARSRLRRLQRGERVVGAPSVDGFWPFLDEGVGTVFQARDKVQPVSSVIVLRSERGAYYQSAGSSPEGMAVGASHFLIYQIMRRLHESGVRSFNLGGAGADEPGLSRFKTGFAASHRDLESALFVVARGSTRLAYDAIGALRRVLRHQAARRRTVPTASESPHRG